MKLTGLIARTPGVAPRSSFRSRPSPWLGAGLAALLASFQSVQLAGSGLPRPISGNVQERAVRIDPATGRTAHVPLGAREDGAAAVTVYDNTCPSSYYYPLAPASQFPGSTQALAFGDWGALPSTAAPATATCTPGSADTYQIVQFTIAYCTTQDERLPAVINFWNGPQDACMTPLFGTLLTNGPAPTETVHTVLPRCPSTQFLACYAIQVSLGTPGFALDGGTVGLTDLALAGDRFAWSIQFPSTDGTTGPRLSGYRPSSSCTFCAGTIWEVGGPSASPGTGLGQTNRVFAETFGGPSGDCFRMADLAPSAPWQTWAGVYLELGALDPDADPTAFCDASDGALAACPCGNAGTPDTGCDNAQGTGGVRLDLVAQTTGPNGATLVGTGYPAMASPTAIVLRSNALAASPVAFGDGVRCLAASPLVRLAATTATGGTSTHAFGHGAMAGAGTFHYQVWYRNTPSSYCDASAAFNLSSGRTLDWP